MKNKKPLTVVTGVATTLTTLTASTAGLISPAQAAAALPACDATLSDSAVTATLNASNAALLANYKKSVPFKKLVAATAAKAAVLKKAKTAKAKAAAAKAVAAAKAKETAGITAFRKANFVYSTSGSNTPAAIAATDRPGVWSWGTYTTRAVFRGGQLVNVCTSVDESAAGNDLGTAATADDIATSASLYQGMASGMDQDIPGAIPVLQYAALAKPAVSQTAIINNVSQCITQDYMTTSAPCIKGGLALTVGGLTGATYTVSGFKDSLQAALTSAKALHVIA